MKKELLSNVKIINEKRLKEDWEFIFLNGIVNKIPIWTLRRFIYKQMGMEIGEGSRIGIGTIIQQPQNIVIGQNCIINEYCHLDGRGGITIENNVGISIYSKIFTGSHDIDDNRFRYKDGEVIIRNNVWIASDAIIIGASLLKRNSVVCAGSVVKGILEENGVYYGNPAVYLRRRKLKEAYKLDYSPYFR